LPPTAEIQAMPENHVLPGPAGRDFGVQEGIQVGIVQGHVVPGPAEQAEQTPDRIPNHMLARRGTAILDRYEGGIEERSASENPQFDHVQEWERAVAHRNAVALRNAKDRGLVSPGMIEHATAGPGVNPYAVNELPLDIQQGFRKKMLTILFLQMCFSLAVAFFVRYVPGVSGVLEKAFPPQGIPTLVLLAVVMFGLPLMSCIKDNHPWNLVFTAGWSVLLGLFLGASDLPGAYSRAHAFLMIFLELTCGILLLIPFCLLKTVDADLGRPKLWGFASSGMCSWLLTIAISALVFTQAKGGIDWNDIEPEPIFATVTVVSTVIFTWFCYEAFKLSCRMKPDEYMKGVIYFYTDMFYVCACCAVLACLGGTGGGGAGAPPRDEEER